MTTSDVIWSDTQKQNSNFFAQSRLEIRKRVGARVLWERKRERGKERENFLGDMMTPTWFQRRKSSHKFLWKMHRRSEKWRDSNFAQTFFRPQKIIKFVVVKCICQRNRFSLLGVKWAWSKVAALALNWPQIHFVAKLVGGEQKKLLFLEMDWQVNCSSI